MFVWATVVPAPPPTLFAALPVNASNVALEKTAGERESSFGSGGTRRIVPAVTRTFASAGKDATERSPAPDFSEQTRCRTPSRSLT